MTKRTANPPDRLALVTGASSGIGEALADVFAAHGFNLVLAARREDRLRAVAARLEEAYGVRAHVIPSDLAAEDGARRLCDELEARGLEIDVLVNSAGYGVPGVYTASTWSTQRALLRVTIDAPAELVHRLLPGMVKRGYGRILNVASLAGLMPAPAGHTLYAGSKSFVIKFSEALAAEVAPLGVYVTALCPGFTYTEFHDVTGTRERVKRLPRFLWMDAQSVARIGFEAVMRGRVVEVPGRVNRAIAWLGRHLSRGILNALTRTTARGYRQT